MSDLEVYIINNYGTCDKEAGCYTDNGCLKMGWIGVRCPHWHPISGQEMEKMKEFWND